VSHGQALFESLKPLRKEPVVDCIAVYKIDRFGRSVLHLNQQLAALTSRGVRFIATSRLLLQILASVAEFAREMIRERTLSGIRAA
jgi:DNA invertase Pin-like site-specific DNA recombinase